MSKAGEETDVDVVVIGTGFAGIYAIHRFRESGLRVRAFEAAEGVGGTWFWNRYPGARCDTKSLDYSYAFSPELQEDWEWTEDYATQEEILRYLNHVTDRFDLRREITFGSRVTRCTFDEREAIWTVVSDQGHQVRSRFVALCTGPLSIPTRPQIDGLDDFAGRTLYTAYWPREGVDLAGKKVGIVGTGSSAVQAIPVIAAEAGELWVFQRTPNFVIPAHNRPLRPEFQREWKDNYASHREWARTTPNGLSDTPGNAKALDVSEEERRAAYEAAWAEGGPKFVRVYKDLLMDRAANDTAAEFVRDKIRARVDDPEVAELLCPRIPIGGKRSPADTEYFEAYNRPNVHLIDIRSDPIVRITSDGVETETQNFPVDVLILATGFDAMTGAVNGIDIRGRDGQVLKEKWSGGPMTFLGLGVEGFPNLFIVSGPGSPSVTCNMALAAEQHVEWIDECIKHMDAHDLVTIEADIDAEHEWVEHVNAEADKTLFPTVDSWYVGANVPGKPRVFMPYVGGAGKYREICDYVAGMDYLGFRLAGAAVPAGASAGQEST